jgi:hypothetical protein
LLKSLVFQYSYTINKTVNNFNMSNFEDLIPTDPDKYEPPANWRNIVAEADPLIKLTCPHWRNSLEPITEDGDSFIVAIRQPDGTNGALFQTVSARHEAKMDLLEELIKEKFKPDDDAMTRLRSPWTREVFYRHYDHELLSTVAVLAGVKPAALISAEAIYKPEVRVSLSRLDLSWMAADFLTHDGHRQLAVGSPESVSLIKAAFGWRRDAEKKGEDIPKEYYRILGQALGYSNYAISYFLYRNENLGRICNPKDF